MRNRLVAFEAVSKYISSLLIICDVNLSYSTHSSLIDTGLSNVSLYISEFIVAA